MARRLALAVLGLALAAGLRGSLEAQTKRVSLAVSLSAPASDGGRKPQVRLLNLLADRRWAQALDASLPIILDFRLEIWRSREGWIDEYQRTTDWQMIVTKEPLEDEYTVTTVASARPVTVRFASQDSVAYYLEIPRQVDVSPVRSGKFYYTLTLRITALSDAEMDDLEKFLEGDPDAAPGRQGSTVGRSLRRLLLRLAGLPSEELQVRSETFVVRRD